MYANYLLNKIEGRYVVYNRIDRKHYEIGYTDYKILEFLKENKSDDYICEQLSIQQDELEKNKSQLISMNFISKQPLKRDRELSWNKIYFFRLDTSWIKVNPITMLLERVLIIVSTISFFLFMFLLNSSLDFNDIFFLDSSNFLELGILFLIVQIITMVIHEFCHLIFAINRGAIVPEMGVMLYFLSPSGFTDLTQTNFFQKKSSRIICLLAGFMFNFSLLSFSLLFFLTYNMEIFRVIFIANCLAISINLGFYIKLDGYYILQILLDEQQLREKSLKFIRDPKKWEFNLGNFIYFIIGICSLIYIPIVFVNFLVNFRSFIS